jgi:hypothetical protein
MADFSEFRTIDDFRLSISDCRFQIGRIVILRGASSECEGSSSDVDRCLVRIWEQSACPHHPSRYDSFLRFNRMPW